MYVYFILRKQENGEFNKKEAFIQWQIKSCHTYTILQKVKIVRDELHYFYLDKIKN